MYTRKLDVDKQVKSILGRTRDDRERSFKGYQIARMYYDAQEFTKAKRYVESFLAVKSNFAPGHKLHGLILQSSKQYNDAVEAFKRSLQLDQYQRDLLLKICECLAAADKIDKTAAKAWIEKSEVVFPHHDIVFSLKERVVGKASSNVDTAEESKEEDMEELLVNELLHRPLDVSLNVKLLQHYMNSATSEGNSRALERALDVEARQPFWDSLTWYSTLTQLLHSHQVDRNPVVLRELLWAQVRYVALLLTAQQADALGLAIHRLDQLVQELSQHKEKSVQSAAQEAGAQLLMLAIDVVASKAKSGKLSWTEAKSLGAAACLGSYQIGVVRKAGMSRLERRRCQAASWRLACVGYTFLQYSGGDVAQFLSGLQQSQISLRDRLYDEIIVDKEQRRVKNSSYLANSEVLVNAWHEIPELERLEEYVCDGHQLYAHSLSSLVWIALQKVTSPSQHQQAYHWSVFNSLPLEPRSLELCRLENMARLDTEVFFYTVVWCVLHDYACPSGAEAPRLLPFFTSPHLCTNAQQTWWSTALKSMNTKGVNSQDRLVIQRGLEAVRLTQNASSVHPELLLHIANTLKQQTDECMPQPEQEAYLRYSLRYYKQALAQLEVLAKQRTPPASKPSMLFHISLSTVMSTEDVAEALSETHQAIADVLSALGKSDEVEMHLKASDTPRSKTQLGSLYKTRACRLMSEEADDSTVNELLDSSRHMFFAALDKLGSKPSDELNDVVNSELEELDSLRVQLSDSVATELSSIQTPKRPGPARVTALRTPISRSTPATALRMSESERGSSSSMYETATFGSHVSPSPERLDAQMRSLMRGLDLLVSKLEKVAGTFGDAITSLTSSVEQHQLTQNSSNEVLVQIVSEMQAVFQSTVQSLDTKEKESQQTLTSLQALATTLQGVQQSQLSLTQHTQLLSQLVSGHHQMYASGLLQEHAARMSAASSAPGQGIRTPIPPRAPSGLAPSFSGGLSKPHEQAGYIPDECLEQEYPYGNRTGTEGSKGSVVAYHPSDVYEHYGKIAAAKQPGTAHERLAGQPLFTAGVPGAAGSITGAATGESVRSPLLTAALKDSSIDPAGLSGSAAGLSYEQFRGPPPNVSFTKEQLKADEQSTDVVAPARWADVMVVRGNYMKQDAQRLVRVGGSSLLRLAEDKASQRACVAVEQEGRILVQTQLEASTQLQKVPGDPTGQVWCWTGLNRRSNQVELSCFHMAMDDVQPFKQAFDTLKLKYFVDKQAPGLSSGISVLSGGLTRGTPLLQTPTQPFTPRSPLSAPTLTTKVTSPTTVGSSSITSSIVGSSAMTSTPATSSSVTAGDQSASTQAKTLFGGFTFSGTPTLQKPKEPVESTVSEAEKSENPFAGFSFGTSSTASPFSLIGVSTKPDTNVTEKSAEKPATDKPTSMFGSGGMSFGDLASNKQDSAFKTTGGFTFGGEGSKVFDSKSPAAKSAAAGEEVEEFEPEVDFKPIISLPKLVEVKTGEEGEVAEFVERCKLYRYDLPTKQWKERGLGNIKILRDEKENKHRVMMRREQVLKLCANHKIVAGMTIKYLPSSDTMLSWQAMDYADEELKQEMLAVRFKLPERAAEFKRLFEEAVSKQGAGTPKKADKAEKAKSPDKKTGVDAPEKSPLVSSTDDVEEDDDDDDEDDEYEDEEGEDDEPSTEDFTTNLKPAEGSWSCEVCLCSNPGDRSTCIACETPRPGAQPPKPAEKSNEPVYNVGAKTSSGVRFGGNLNSAFGAPSTTSGFSGFGQTKPVEPATSSEGKATDQSTDKSTEKTDKPKDAAVADIFKRAEGSWTCDVCMVNNTTDLTKCAACDAAKPGTTQQSQPASSAGTAYQPGAKTSGGFTFGGTFSAQQSPFTGFGAKSQDQTDSSGNSTIPKPFAPKLSDAFKQSEPSGSQGKATFSSSLPPVGSSTESSSTFTFGKDTAQTEKSTGGFTFSLAPKTTDKSAATPTGTAGATPTGPAGVTSPTSPEYYKNVEGDDAHIEFAPVLEMPDHVEVRTGEEEEAVLYSQRSRLYRLRQGEWKERGTGDMKLLKDTQGRVRLLMRREPVLKVCCNIRLTSELKFESQTDRSCLFRAVDHSDQEPSYEQFALRFKTPQLLNEFFETVRSAQKEVTSSPTKAEATSPTTAKPASSCIDAATKADVLKSVESNVPAAGSTAAGSSEKQSTPTSQTQTSPLAQPKFSFTSGSIVSGKSIFGQSPAQTDSTSKPSLFGTSSTTGKSIFGQGSVQTDSTPQPSLFGSSPATGTTPQFGTSAFGSFNSSFETSGTQPAANSSTSTPQVPAQSVFGQSPSVFGQSVLGALGKQTSPANNPFTAADDDVQITYERRPTDEQLARARRYMLPDCFFCYENDQPSDVIDVDSYVPTGYIKIKQEPETDTAYGKATESAPAVSQSAFMGSTSGPSFASLAQGAGSSFASLAQQSTGASGFSFGSNQQFSWQGAGQAVFGVSGRDQAEEDGADDTEHDPHFEPILDLPALVEVKTGEEEESVLFKHRCKLYRFDSNTNQWKERGVGDMKLLKHLSSGRCRLLMRRDQVHKVCCNHVLTPAMELKPMPASETAWTWVTTADYSETTDGQREFLAVRFKHKEQSDEFKSLFEANQNWREKSQSDGTVQPTGSLDSSGPHASSERQSTSDAAVESETGPSDGQESDGYESDQEASSDEGNVLFQKRASLYEDSGSPAGYESLGVGEMSVLEDDDMECYRLRMTSDAGESLCSHYIVRETKMEAQEKFCLQWSPIDFSKDEGKRRKLRVRFSSQPAVDEFLSLVSKGVELARQADISENVGAGISFEPVAWQG